MEGMHNHQMHVIPSAKDWKNLLQGQPTSLSAAIYRAQIHSRDDLQCILPILPNLLPESGVQTSNLGVVVVDDGRDGLRTLVDSFPVQEGSAALKGAVEWGGSDGEGMCFENGLAVRSMRAYMVDGGERTGAKV